MPREIHRLVKYPKHLDRTLTLVEHEEEQMPALLTATRHMQ